MLVIVMGLVVLPAKAQTILGRPYTPNQIVVETLIPDTPEDASFPSGATFLTGTASLSRNIEFIAELPVARFNASGQQVSSTSALGNPYAGFGFSSTRVPFLFELGARFPVAPSNRASQIGALADVGRTAAFRADEFSLSALFNVRRSLGRFTSLRLRFGTTFASSDELGGTDDNETAWRLQYDAQLWREGNSVITGFSFTGRNTVSSPSTSQHHAMLSVMANWTRVQPGIVAGLSLNDLFNDSTFTPVAGLTLSLSYLR